MGIEERPALDRSLCCNPARWEILDHLLSCAHRHHQEQESNQNIDDVGELHWISMPLLKTKRRWENLVSSSFKA